MKFKFSKKCIQYLKNLPYDSKDEISGSFNLTCNGNICIANVDENLYSKGTNEEVESVNSKYSFHSHPKEAYKKYNVELGWPSNQDYLSFLKSCMRYGTLFHTVITIEGIYIITLGDYLKNSVVPVSAVKKFICDKYYFENTGSRETVKSYVKKINAIRYNGYKLFNLNFVKWTDFSLKTFKI
jgi:hypothetical protein